MHSTSLVDSEVVDIIQIIATYSMDGSLSTIMFLGGVGQHSNLANVDSVIDEILKAKAPKKGKGIATSREEGPAPQNLNDESFTSTSTDASTEKEVEPRVLCSMPYTRENRVGAVVAAIEFARRNSTPPLPSTTSTTQQEKPKSSYSLISDAGFEAELAQRDHLNSISSFRKTLMAQIAKVDSDLEAKGGEGNGDSDDELDELRNILP